MFRRQAQLPVDIMYGTPYQQDTTSDYAAKLQQTLMTAFALARTYIGIHQERQADNYNKEVHGDPYEEGGT